MPLYMNFVCDVCPKHSRDSLQPVFFDHPDETYGSLLDFMRSNGWKVETGDDHRVTHVECPKHSAVSVDPGEV